MKSGDCLRITEDGEYDGKKGRVTTGYYNRFEDTFLYLDVGNKSVLIYVEDIVSLETITSEVKLTTGNASKIGVPSK